MEKNSPEYQGNSWIWWSLGAILATAAITVTLVGLLTGSWPWNRGAVQYEGRPSSPTETVTVPGTDPSTEPEIPGTDGNGESINGGGNGQNVGSATQPSTSPTESEQTEPTTKPTEPEPTTKPTEPEQTEPTTQPTEPEQTEPTTQPTEPEEDEGGGEKPQPGDIDVPIGPRP